MPEITPECLSKAADLIEAKGWGQRRYHHGMYPCERSNFCLLGAIVETCNFADKMERSYYEDKAAQMLGFQDAEHAAEWNDDECRTAVEVIARLRSLA